MSTYIYTIWLSMNEKVASYFRWRCFVSSALPPEPTVGTFPVQRWETFSTVACPPLHLDDLMHRMDTESPPTRSSCEAHSSLIWSRKTDLGGPHALPPTPMILLPSLSQAPLSLSIVPTPMVLPRTEIVNIMGSNSSTYMSQHRLF